jgi:phage shock protein PspC (stress-responsive transcriptional regulator)
LLFEAFPQVVVGLVADFAGVDPTLVRVIFVASLLLPGPQAIVYVILWILMPAEPE